MSATSDYLEILIKLGIDPRGANDVKNGIRSAESLLEELGDKSKEISDEDLDFIRKKMEAIKKATAGANAEFERTKNQIKKTKEEARQLNQVAEKLTGIGARATAAGAAILAPLLLAQKAYLDTSKNTETTSRTWLSTSKDIEASQQRLGRVVTDTLLPGYKSVANAVRLIAAVAEQNPWLVQGVLATGGALAVGGPLAALVGQGIKIAADAKFLAANALFAASVDKYVAATGAQALGGGGKIVALGSAGMTGTLIAAATAIAAGVLGSAVAVSLVNDLISRTRLGQEIDDAQDRIRQTGKAYPGVVRSISAGESGTPKSSIDLIRDLFSAALGGSPGYGVSGGKIGPPQAYGVPGGKIGPPAIGASESAINQAVDAEKARLKSITDTAVELYAARESQIADIEKQTEKQRTSIVESAGRERTNLEKQASKALAEYAKNERQAEQDYRRSRLEVAQAAGKEEARAEEDHQREMLRLKADHQMRSDDLVASGDALGFVLEQRRYEAERQQAESEHDVEVRRRNEDLADQLAQLEYSFRVQRARRREDFEQTLKDFEEQKKIIDENERRALEDLNLAHQEQLDLVEQNLRERLNKLDATLLGDQAAVEKASAEMASRFRSWLQNASSSLALAAIQTQAGNAVTSTSTGGGGGGSGSIALRRAFGGYAEYGKYLLGDSQSGGPGRREFVLDGMATQAAETAIGGQLSQAAIINAIRNNASNSGSSSRRIDYHDNRRFSGGISAQERRGIRKDMEDVLSDTFRSD